MLRLGEEVRKSLRHSSCEADDLFGARPPALLPPGWRLTFLFKWLIGLSFRETSDSEWVTRALPRASLSRDAFRWTHSLGLHWQPDIWNHIVCARFEACCWAFPSAPWRAAVRTW